MDLGDAAVGALLFGLGWLASRLFAVAGRRTAASIDRVWSRVSTRSASRRADRAAKRAADEETARLSALERERVGRAFIRHVTSDDPGMVGTVLGLDKRHPDLRVSMRWLSADGRVRQADDYSTDRTTSIEWKTLVKSPADQIHFTARMVLGELTDDNGWVEFEPFSA